MSESDGDEPNPEVRPVTPSVWPAPRWRQRALDWWGTEPFAHRSDVLVHPLFWISIVVLILNDRVFKASHPGVLTGKLSDVAGVIMVTILVVGITGRVRTSLVVVAVLFGLLKTVPPVADLAVPVLGGRTRTDPTDLIALGALLPLGWWLTRTSPRVRVRPVDAGPAGEPLVGNSAAAVRTAAKIGGVLLAVLATSATSCVPYTSFDRVEVADNGTFVAGDDTGLPRWRLRLPIADTADGNGEVQAWVSVASPGPDQDPSQNAEPPSSTRECVDDATCVEIRGLSIVEIDPAGGERMIADFNSRRGAINSEIGSSCQDDVGERFPDIATDGQVVVVAMGVLGAMVRTPDGSWVGTGADEAFPSLADYAVREQRLRWAAYLLPIAVYAAGVVLVAVRPTSVTGRVLGIAVGVLLLLAILAFSAVVISITGSSGFGFAISVVASLVLALFMFGMSTLRSQRAQLIPDPPYPS